ncbi:MAG: PKD domain-containing protein [Candidatus Gracilibacteria bacterium]|nr:PKD domain-containing protein [Candidatus Gracilibacteria bacterium]
MKKIILYILLLTTFFGLNLVYSAEEALDYTSYRTVDLGTYNEYRYKLTKEFFELRNQFELNGQISSTTLTRIESIAKEGFNYLPDELTNENLLSKLLTSINQAKKSRSSEAYYADLVEKLRAYVEDVKISSLKGTLDAIPDNGNAPLNVTFRALVSDPEGTTIPKYNYVWWMDIGGVKKILGTGLSLNYTFEEEGKYTVFVDVKSNHKNNKGFTDVLSFRSKRVIDVKEKVASLIIKVNGDSLRFTDELKFTPEEGKFGLIFDATSSIPTGGAKFTKTIWDFGNGVKKSYDGEPKIERVIYNKEGDYQVELTLKTNLGDNIVKKFTVSIHEPIASIEISPKEGYIGDKFTFTAKTAGKDENLTYYWEVIDVVKDKIIFQKQAKLFTYTFTSKGHFNVRLQTSSINSNDYDVDTAIIYINSRAPVANFKYSIPKNNKPNRVLLDATDTYDPDYTDDGQLKYSWVIDGNRVELEDPNSNGSLGYYTFDSIGDHSVVLEVTDPENIQGIIDKKVNVRSILAVDFTALPRSVQRGNSVKFSADSPRAVVYEWDFGDGHKDGGTKPIISYKYEKSGIYNVTLKVRDLDDNINSYSKTVYVGDGNSPVAVIELNKGSGEAAGIEKGACDGKDAYIVDRSSSVTFDASESIDVNGEETGLDYSFKIGNNKYYTTRTVNYKFDELGCFPVKLTVKSVKDKSISTKSIWVKVVNLKPTLDGISTNITNIESDPVVVNVSALGAKDPDGVITSYLWYYYTDVDSEPQDFRATTSSNTTFVLPKIAGNYYFVVVLTDDNSERISSEELSRVARITLMGDNINVPLVELNVPDNSVFIKDEVVFTANVKTILGKNITKDARYSWDFDGDGFYDQETSSSVVSHVYTKPGEYLAKLKVKHKGFTNTRIVKIDVANKLEADFDYISIGNNFVFVNKSTGAYSDITWDLGDGNKVLGKNAFQHEYKDGKISHDVKILITEGTIVKKIEKKVVKSVSNLLESKQSGFHVFASPEISSGSIINIKEEVSGILVYLGANNGNITKYSVDTDISVDSDLNGGKDDDEDLQNTTGEAFIVFLDENKIQIIKASIYDEDGVLIDSKELTINKDYLEIVVTDPSTVVFEGVTLKEKEKLEYLKSLLINVPQEYKLKSMMYLQKLKEEWFDDTEKTKVILEFEGYLDETNILNKDEIIDTLESLLVEQEEDKSDRNVALNALKNLIPENIFCEYTSEYNSCKEELVAKLEAIKVSKDVEVNKTLGEEILSAIALNQDMTADEKLDFKAILQNLIYGGVDDIPDDAIDDTEESTTDGAWAMLKNILVYIVYIIGGLLGFFLVIVGVYYIYYKVVNKNKNLSFQDFIIDKTKYKSEEENADILSTDIKKEEPVSTEIFFEEETEKSETREEEAPSWITGVSKEKQAESIVKQDTKKETGEDNIPSWLKGADEVVYDKKIIKEEKEQTKDTETIQEEIHTEEKVPDWLKGSFTEQEEKVEEKPVETKEIEKKVEEPKEENLEEITKVEEEKVPDWLKGSFTEEKTPSKKEEKVPDWLKGSFTEQEEKVEEKPVETKEIELQEAPKVEEDKKEEKVEQVEVKEEEKFIELKEVKKEETKDEAEKAKPKKKRSRGGKKKKQFEGEAKEAPKQDKTESKTEEGPELWDNGMDIPDWLKSDKK